MRRRRSILALAPLALLALSCGARTDLRDPREIALERTGRRLVFALDYSLTGFAHTANEPTISSWQSAIRMTETVASAMDSSVLVGGLVYPHPLGPQNVSCRIDDSMLTVPTAGAEAFVRLARSFTQPLGASATYDALQRIAPLAESDGAPSVVVLFADGAPHCRREFDRAACRCLNSTGDCTSTNPEDPPGLLWGCDDTARVVSAITTLRDRGVKVFVVGAHKLPELTIASDLETLRAMASAAQTPGPNAPHPYYRSDVPAQRDELRARVVEALSATPCRLRAAESIPREPFTLVFDDEHQRLTELHPSRWHREGDNTIVVDDRAVCGVPSPRRLRLVDLP